MDAVIPASTTPEILAGAGEMAGWMRETDWSRTPLGAAERWPHALKTTARMVLAAPTPMAVLWGPELAVLYNDAARRALGRRHPEAFGQPAAAVFRGIWDKVGPLAAQSMRDGLGTRDEPRHVTLLHGCASETWLELSFAPITGDQGVIGGLLCTLEDCTERVVGARRSAVLRTLARRVGPVRTADEVARFSARLLQEEGCDLPFVAIYLTQPDARRLVLTATSRIAPGDAAVPDLLDPEPGSAVADVVQTQRIRVIPLTARVLGGGSDAAGPVGGGGPPLAAETSSAATWTGSPPMWDVPPTRAALVPLGSAGRSWAAGVLVAGLNPYRPFDDAYRGFLELAATQIGAALECAVELGGEPDLVRRELDERRRAEEALRESERRYRDLVHALPAAVYTTDAEGRILLYNEAAVELWGRAPRIGHDRFGGALEVRRRDGTLLPPEAGPMAVTLREQRRLPPEEVVVVRPDGTTRHVLAHPQPLHDASGALVGGTNMLVDITARHRAERELADTRDSLDQRVAALSRLHELALRLTGTSELRPALEAILATLVEVHDADFGLVLLYDPSEGQLCEAAHVELTSAAVAALARVQPGPAGGPCGTAYATRERVVVADVRTEGSTGRSRAEALAAGVLAVHCTPILTRTGEPLGVLTVYLRKPHRPTVLETQLADLCARHAADVVEAVRSRRALRESEARFRQMADHAPVMVWVTEPDGSCSFLSRSWYKFTGRSAPGGLGLGWTMAIHPEDRPAAARAYMDAHESQRPLRLEYRLRRHDGEYRWALDAATPRFGDDGRFLGLIGSVIDVTDEKRKEQALQASERLYRAIGESIDYGVWISDPEGSVTYVSESFLKLTGRTRDGLAGLDHVHPEDRAGVEAAWAEARRTGGQIDREQRVLGADGSWHPVLTRGVAVRDDAGAVVGWAGINLDISRIKRVEDELRQADQRKNEFLATLAHELRNPLAPLRTGIELLKHAETDLVRVASARDVMERQLHHLVRLVDDLLDLSRITQGKIELRRRPIDLAVVLQSAIETSRPGLDHAQHLLTVALPSAPIWVDGDMTRLAQVFANLLNNAARYTKDGGHIRLSVVAADDHVKVSVRDNGVGIPGPMLDRVFDLFTQVDRSLERAQPGLGIGLSIARRLVDMHGGEISVHSDGDGCGSEFVVRLATVPPLEPAPPADERPKATKRRRILVADDNVDAAASLALLIELGGNEVRTAYDGQDAVEQARLFRPDVILLDLGMPRLDGYEACRRIRQEEWAAGVVVIALTGWGQDEDKRRSREAGFDHHLVKPIDPDELEALLAEAVVRDPDGDGAEGEDDE